jgi:hypothetical protein
MRALCLLLLATPAFADTGEASVHPFASYGRGAVAAPGGERAEPLVGGGIVVGYGLSFPFTATLRYDFAAMSGPDADTSGGARTEWQQTRHALLGGVTWSPSDEITPVLGLEAGAALRLVERRELRSQLGHDKSLGATTEVAPAPAFRASAELEWRFADFLGVSAGAFAEHVGGFGYGARLTLAAWHYL